MGTRTFASAAAVLLTSACGSVGQMGSDVTPHPPGPPTAALAKWADFPATAIPRPIIWFDGPNLVRAFPDGESKIAAYCNRFVLPAGLALPAKLPRNTDGGLA